MVNLILFIISIALMASMLTVSAVYLPTDALMKNKVYLEGMAGVESLAKSIPKYFQANSSIVLPVSGTDVSGLVMPEFGFIPAAPTGMQWTLQSGHYLNATQPDAIVACLQAKPGTTMTSNSQVALARMQTKLPVGSGFLADTCLSGQSVAGGTVLNYWFVKSHYTP